MSGEIQNKLEKIPLLKHVVRLLDTIKLPWAEGLTLYKLIELYIGSIVKGEFTYRAGAIAFSFFMAMFPFALFILNLIPYIPLDDFQTDFLKFIEESVPPNTYDAIASILTDILNTSYKSLISTGILLSILLMSNGMNAILSGFQSSSHITIKRGFIRQYIVAIGLSLLFTILLIITVAAIVIMEVIMQNLSKEGYLYNEVLIIQIGRYLFLIIMILMGTSLLFKFAARETRSVSFFSYGSVFTTILFIVTSYVFGIYVLRFAQYNELYGSIGTLLVLMIYIWINCFILLIGFELNAVIYKLKRKKLYI